MKPHFNRLAIVITWALTACSIHASVPLRWTVETSRANVETFDAYHGETLDLDAALLSYGAPLLISGDARLFYQTNGMDSAWWSVPATIAATNHIQASFAPPSDPGAQQLNCFLGVTGSIYRAAFRVRFRNSPGAAPNVLQPPVKVLDYADLSVLNAPYWTKAEADNRYGGASITSNVVQQIADNTVARAGHIQSYDGVATNLTVGGELKLTNFQGDLGVIQFNVANSETPGSYYTDWYFGVPGHWLGEYRFRKTTSDFETIAFTSDIDHLSATATNIAEYVVSTNGFVKQSSLTDLDASITFHSSLEGISWNSDGTNMGFMLRPLGVGENRLSVYDGSDNPIAYLSDVEAVPSTYGATNQLAAANCTVQTVVDPAGDTLPQFQVPPAVAGGVRDWVVHVVSSGSTDITLTGFPATVDSGKTASFFSPLDSVTNKCTHGTITTFYFSEINSTANAVNFMVNRAELKKISPAN